MKKVLFVPAWWPCGFFKDQQEITVDEYTPYNIYGECSLIPLKKIIPNFFKKEKCLKCQISTKAIHVKLSWIKYRSPKRLNKQLSIISEMVGEWIIDLCGGVKPDFIHIQSISDIAVFVTEWAKNNNIPIILTEHILYVRHSTDCFSRLRESVYCKADKVLCVSNYLYRNLLTSGFSLQKPEIIGNFVNDKYVPNNLSDIEKNGRILFVASHTHDKDINTLIKTASILKGKLKIDIAGLSGIEDIGNGEKLSDEVLKYKLENTITFLGQIDHEKLLKLYPEYSALCSTSLSETFGLAIAEAIAYGTKVFCTDSGGIRDFLTDNNSCIVQIGDSQTLASSIELYLSSPYCEASEQSRLIVKKYGEKVFRRKMFKIYSNLISV